MREKVNKIIKKRTLLFRSIIIFSIIVVFGVSAKTVYSNSQFDITIKYLEDIFDPQKNIFDPEENNQNKWFFNSSEIIFEVDFSEYYKEAKNKLRPMDQNIRPFTVTANLNERYNFDTDDISIEKVLVDNNEFDGRYKVKLTVPTGNNNDKLNIKITGSEGDIWEIPEGLSTDFSIIRDLKKPEINLEGISRNLSVEDEIIISLEDNYASTAKMIINLKNEERIIKENTEVNGEEELVINPLEEKYEDGYYTGTIDAIDKADNKIDIVKNIEFYVNNNAPTITFNGEDIKEFYNKGILELKAHDALGIDLITSKYTLKNVDNPSKSITGQFTEKDNKNAVAQINLTEDAKYELDVTVFDKRGKSKKVGPKAAFIVDTIAPKVDIEGVNKVEDSNEIQYYNENQTVIFKIEDKNLKQITLNEEIINKAELKQDRTNKDLYTYEYKANVNEGESKKFDFTITAEDEVGLKSPSQSISFVIDKKKPTVKFTGVENDKYYNTDKEVTIKVEDDNLDKDNITVVAKKYSSDTDTEGTAFDIGEFTDGILTKTFDLNSRYTIEVNGSDQSGNPIDNKANTITFTIDKIAPMVNIVNQEILNGSFKEEVDSVKLTIDELNFNRDNLDIEVTKTKINSKPDTFEVEDKNLKELPRNNGNYEFEIVDLFEDEAKYDIFVKFKDKAENPINSTSKNKVSFTVDRTKPNINITKPGKNKYYKDDKVDFEVRIQDDNYSENDNYNGNKVTVEKISKKIGEKEVVEPDVYTNFTSEKDEKVFTKSFDQEGIYNIKVYSNDKANNKNETEEVYSFVIDRTAPIIETNFEGTNKFDSDLPNTGTITITELNWKNKYTNKPLKAKIEGEKIINKVSTPINIEFDLEGEITRKSLKDDFKDYFKDDDAVYKFSVSITDIYGESKKSEDVEFGIDKIAPKIDYNGVDNGKYYKQDVEFSTIITDTNHNINKITVTKNDGPYQVGEFSEKDKERKLDHKFTQEGKYKITIESEDKAGNKAEPENIEFTIDKKKPELKITDESDKDIESGKFYNKFKDIHIELTDDNFESYTLKINGEEEKFNKDKNDSTTLTYDFKADKDSEYIISVEAKDKSGNNLTDNGEPKITSFVIDTTKPVVNIEDFDGLNGSFNKKVDSVKVRIKEMNLDESKVNVTLTTTEPNKKSAPIILNGTKLNITKVEKQDDIYEFILDKMFTLNAKYDISIEMTDMAALKNDEDKNNKVSFTVDNTIPDIKVVTPGDKKYYKDAEVPLEVRVKDNNHNTNIITIEKVSKKLGEEAKVDKNDYTSFVPEGSDQVYRRSFEDEGTYNISVYSKDKAGNEDRLKEVYSFVIDRTQPSIVTNFSSINDTYSNPQKNAYIKVSEVNWKNQYTGQPLIANVKGEKITPDNKATSIDLSFPLTGEVTEVNYGNEFADDAIYNLNVSISDSAGMAASGQSVKFVTDKTTPTISIEGVENDQYYNMDRYLVITNNDVNHNINTISIKRNGNAYPIGDFVTEGRDKVAKHTFTQEGEYEVSVTSTDKAGNNVAHPTIKFTVDKTAPVITPLNRNENKVLQNGQYINKLFIPEFRLDKPEDDKIDLISLNGEGNFANSTLMADKEIEYKYKVVASDKAKNSSNLDIGFTVDVTLPEVKISGILSGFFSKDMKPVYDISDKNLDKEKTSVTLNGKPFTSGTTIEEQDNYNLKLVGTDLANNVVTKTIGFTIDKDKPVIKFEEAISGQYFTEDFIPNFVIDDLTDYTIISMTLNGEDYEVGQPIEKEGKHVLYIEVKDKAENIESVSVEFILDKTPPKFIIDGVEEDGRYTEAVSAVIKLDNPSDTIKAVEVNGEIAKGDIKDEDGQEVVTVDFNEIKPYELKLTAVDAAGNVTEETINFEVVEKNVFVKLYQNKPVFYPVVIIAVGAVISIAFIILKKSKKKKVEQDDEVNE